MNILRNVKHFQKIGNAKRENKPRFIGLVYFNKIFLLLSKKKSLILSSFFYICPCMQLIAFRLLQFNLSLPIFLIRERTYSHIFIIWDRLLRINSLNCIICAICHTSTNWMWIGSRAISLGSYKYLTKATDQISYNWWCYPSPKWRQAWNKWDFYWLAGFIIQNPFSYLNRREIFRFPSSFKCISMKQQKRTSNSKKMKKKLESLWCMKATKKTALILHVNSTAI